MRETYVIHITQKCNCDCVYCYEEDKTSVYSWDEIKALLDDILQYAPEEFGIEFLGGEPCLRIDLIRKVVDYLPDVGHFAITTNGTLINEELIELLRDDIRITWSASIDGHRFANMLRVFKGSGVNTYDTVIENYNTLRQRGVRNEQLSFHITSHHYNVGYLRDSVHHLYDVGFRQGAVGIIESTMEIGPLFCEELKRQMAMLTHDCYLGKLEGLYISEFHTVNPREDKRTYIYNEDGAIVAESYGRADGDITHQKVEGLESVAPGGEKYIADLIYDTRTEVMGYYQSFGRFYGCGVGRNASRTLTEYLNRIPPVPNRTTIHESRNPLVIPYEFSEKVLHEILMYDENIVQNSLLNYAEAMLPSSRVRFICIRRDKEEYVDSFLTSRKFSPERSWLDMESPELYPKYGDIPLQEGLRRYWDEYYSKAEQLSIDYENFRLIEFEDFINLPPIKEIENEANETTNQRSCSCRKRKEASKN